MPLRPAGRWAPTIARRSATVTAAFASGTVPLARRIPASALRTTASVVGDSWPAAMRAELDSAICGALVPRATHTGLS
jgi:hypothetical protein